MMQESSTPQTCPTSTLSAAASLVSLFLSQGNDLDLLTKEARSFMKSADWLKPGTLNIFCLRTCRGYSLTKGGKLSSLSSPRLGNWGILLNGVLLTAQTSVSPRIGSECTLSDILIADCPAKYILSEKAHIQILSSLFPDANGAAVCLMSQGGGQGAKTGLYLIDMNENPKLTPLARCITARQDSGISNRKGEHSGVLITGARAILTPERLKVRQCGRRFKGPDEPMYALTTQDVHGVILLNGIIRRLMPIECFRLQGFADNQFQTLADNGISDSQLYKMAGNSVTTNVVTAIAQKLAWEINQLPNETEETT